MDWLAEINTTVVAVVVAFGGGVGLSKLASAISNGFKDRAASARQDKQDLYAQLTASLADLHARQDRSDKDLRETWDALYRSRAENQLLQGNLARSDEIIVAKNAQIAKLTRELRRLSHGGGKVDDEQQP
jgi:hypothetical protein